MKTKFIFLVLFSISITTFSQINSYTINQTIIGPGMLYFDLNHDGTQDFLFDITTLSINVLAAGVLPVNSSAILDNSTFGYPDTLNYDDPVSGYFQSDKCALGTFNNAAHFNGAGEKYLGIKIHDSGNNYLGWIKLYCSINRDTLKIISCGYTTIASDPIKAGQTTTNAINENELKSPVSIDPNPLRSLTTIRTDNYFHSATLTVHNCLGQTVKQIKNINGQTIVLSRDHLVAGLYFVQLTQGNQVITTKKLIITD